MLLKYFSRFGKIRELKLIRNERFFQSEGFAKISFVTHIARSTLSHKHFLKDKEIEVREYQNDEDKFIMKCYRKTKKIFVGGLSIDTGKTALRNYFEQFGPIYDISIPINFYSKQSKGFAFIQFEHQNSVEKVLTHHKSHCVDGKFIECKCAIYRDEMKVEQIIPKEADTFSSESEKEEEYTTNKVFNQETLDAKRVEKRTKKEYFDE